MGLYDTAWEISQLGKKGLLLVNDTSAHPRANGYSGFKVLAATVISTIVPEVIATTDDEEGTVVADITAMTLTVGDVVMLDFTDITLTSGELLLIKR